MSIEPFRPLPGLAGAHRQTLGAWLLGPSAEPVWTPERLELADGDFVDLAHLGGDSGCRVCLFHGLEGSIRSHYVGGLAEAFRRRGHAVTFLHFRGCSGEPNRLPRAYHSGDTGDIAALLDALGARHPGEWLAAVGVSLGGNALLKYLGECGHHAPLSAAATISVPFDLGACANRIDRGFSRIYQRHLVDQMKRSARARWDAVGSLPVDRERMERSRTFREFDEYVTAPLHGFDGAEDYYARASSGPWLGHIRRPTLLIQALDDPFVGPEPVPGPGDVSPCVEHAVSAHGGHVGFIGATPGRRLRPDRWLERVLPAWLSARLARSGPGERADPP